MDIRRYAVLIAAWLVGFLIGLGIVGFVVLAVQGKPHEIDVPTIICPPFMDKALREVRIDVWYEAGQGPEFTELDYEFVEACGFETITGPMRIEPPPEEEGGA